MASNSVGQVTVEIVADASKFEKDLPKAVGSASKKAEPEAEKGGKGIGNALSKGVGGLLKTSGVAIGALFSASMVKGFGRLNAIDQAEQKLLGLGNSAEEVVGIMDQALKAVEGTAFGLGESATLAAAFMAAGVSAGEDLSQALDLTVDAASLAGTSLADMGDIMTDVAAAGKLTGDELNRLSDRGIDALSILSEHYGITRAEAQKMVSDGTVSFEMFAEAMEANIGQASTTSGATFVGAMRNIGAAIGRFGAVILKPFFDGVKAIIPSVITAINDFTAAFKPIFDEIAPGIEKAFEVIAGALASIDWTAIGNLVVGMARVIWNAIVIIVKAIQMWIDAMQPALTNILTAVRDVLASIDWDRVISAIQRMTPLVLGLVAAWLTFNKVQKIMKATTGVIGAAKVATQIFAGATVKLTAAQKKSVVTTKTAAISTKLLDFYTAKGTITTKLATVAQRGFNAAVKAMGGPVMAAIKVISILVAALTWFFTQTELGQEIVANVVAFIQSAWEKLSAFLIPAWEKLSEIWAVVWGAIQAVIERVWSFIQAFIVPIVTFIVQFIVAYITALVNFWSVIWDVVVAVFTRVWEFIKTYIVPVVTFIVEFIVTVFDGLVRIWNRIWNAVGDDFTRVWDAIQTYIVPVVQFIVDFIQEAIERFLAVWTQLWDKVSSVFTTIWNALKSFIVPLVESVVSFLKMSFEAFMAFWGPLWESVKSIFVSIWNIISAFVRATVSFIIAIFTGDFQSIKGIIDSLWNSVKQGTEEIWNSILAWIRQIPQMIKDIFSGAISWLYDAGRNVLQGFWNGLKSIWDSISSWFTGKINGLVASAKDALSIGSPSRVFHEIGENVAQGFINGIEDMSPEIIGTSSVFAQPAQAVKHDTRMVGSQAAPASPVTQAGAQTNISEGAIQVLGSGDPYKAALLVVNRIAERVAL